MITIDGRAVEFAPGETVLVAARRAGIEIPHLCALDWAPSPAAACRMCVVEVEGAPRLMTSCTLEAKDGMSVRTHTPRVLKSRRNIIELMIASHPRDCLVCGRAKTCELSKLAADLGAREQRYPGVKRHHPVDVSSPALERDPDKCILCGRCVTMCHTVQGVGAIDFVGRGFATRVSPGFCEGLNVSDCVFCGQCARVCPTGALVEKSHIDQVVSALGDPDVVVVAQVAPAVPATLLEGKNAAGSVKTALARLSGVLKRIGFSAVFDTSFTADLTIMEEVHELVGRIKNGGPLPMYTSCSPAWIRYVELHAPELIPQLSTCKSPQQMAGAIIKEVYPKHVDLGKKRLVVVSIMPCTAKKHEAKELGDVDYVLTTRELERLLERCGIAFETETDAAPLDSPFGTASGAGRLFGGTGGVMEAAIRTAYRVLTGEELSGGPKIDDARGLDGIKIFSIDAKGTELRFAVVNGLGRLPALLARPDAKTLHFVEVMSCPGGCIGGGGQPYTTDIDAVKGRIERLYEVDRRSPVRASHANEEIQTLYRDFLGEPLGKKSHHLLHRTYEDRSGD
jgi:iron-only hydrogenase group A